MPHLITPLHTADRTLSNVPFANATLSARIDEDNDGGFVGDYYWQYNNEGPYDSFGNSKDTTAFFSGNAGDWMVETAQAVSACAQFRDGSSVVDNGILTLGWNNQPYEWQPGQMAAQFDECNNNPGDS